MIPPTNSSLYTEPVKPWSKDEDKALKDLMYEKPTKAEIISLISAQVTHSPERIRNRIRKLKKIIDEERPLVLRLKVEGQSYEKIADRLNEGVADPSKKISVEEVRRQWKDHKTKFKTGHVYCWSAWGDRQVWKYLYPKDERVTTFQMLVTKLNGGEDKEIRCEVKTINERIKRIEKAKTNAPNGSEANAHDKSEANKEWSPERICRLISLKLMEVSQGNIDKELSREKGGCRRKWQDLKRDLGRLETDGERENYLKKLGLSEELIPEMLKAISESISSTRRDSRRKIPQGSPAAGSSSGLPPIQSPNLPQSTPSKVPSFSVPVNLQWRNSPASLPVASIITPNSTEENRNGKIWAKEEKDFLKSLMKNNSSVKEIMAAAAASRLTAYTQADLAKIIPILKNEMAQYSAVVKLKVTLMTDAKIAEKLGMDIEDVKKEWLEYKTACKKAEGYCSNGWNDKAIRKYLANVEEKKDTNAFNILVAKLKGTRGDEVKSHINRRITYLRESDMTPEELTSTYKKWTPEEVRLLIMLNLEDKKVSVVEKNKNIATQLKRTSTACTKKWKNLFKKMCKQKNDKRKEYLVRLELEDQWITKMLTLIDEKTGTRQNTQQQKNQALPAPMLPLGVSPSQASDHSIDPHVRDEVFEQLRFGCKVDEIADWNNLDKKQIEEIWDKGKMGKCSNGFIEEWTFADDRCLRMFLNEHTSMTMKQFNELCAQNYPKYEPEQVFNCLQEFATLGAPR